MDVTLPYRQVWVGQASFRPALPGQFQGRDFPVTKPGKNRTLTSSTYDFQTDLRNTETLNKSSEAVISSLHLLLSYIPSIPHGISAFVTLFHPCGKQLPINKWHKHHYFPASASFINRFSLGIYKCST